MILIIPDRTASPPTLGTTTSWPRRRRWSEEAIQPRWPIKKKKKWHPRPASSGPTPRAPPTFPPCRTSSLPSIHLPNLLLPTATTVITLPPTAVRACPRTTFPPRTTKPPTIPPTSPSWDGTAAEANGRSTARASVGVTAIRVAEEWR